MSRYYRSFLEESSVVYPTNLKLYLDAGNTLSYSGSGINWYDLTTNVNNGTLINGVGFNSSNRGSLTFNGINQYVEVNNNATLRVVSNDFYIGQFVNFSVIPNNMNLSCIWANSIYSFFFTIIGGKLAFYWSTNGTSNSNLTSTYTPTINTWLYLSVSRTGGNITLYANGVSLVSIPNSDTFYNNIGTPFTIGRNPEISGWELNGKMSHIKFMNGQGLTSTEILNEYNTQKSYYGY